MHVRMSGKSVGVIAAVALMVMPTAPAWAGDDAPPTSTDLQVSTAGAGETTFTWEEDDHPLWRVDDGWDLDRYLYRSSSPLDFTMDLHSPYPHQWGNWWEEPRTVDALLTLYVRDVDEEQGEIDRIVVNGTQLDGMLTGANEQWSTSSFRFDPAILDFGTSFSSVPNEFQVLIDENNEGWAVEVAWAELRLVRALPTGPQGPPAPPPAPIMLNHGITGGKDIDGDGCADTSRDPFDMTLDALVAQPLMVSREQLGNEGWVTCPVTTLNRSAETNADILEGELDEVLDSTRRDGINIIAHSMGGLNSRVLAHRRPDQVHSIQMLGTPNAGSPGANTLCFARYYSDNIVPEMGPCDGPDDGLYQLQTHYVQSVFNRHYPDLPSVDYRVFGGTKGGILSAGHGEDDGTVPLSSVYWLRPEGADVPHLGPQGPDHPGLHEPGPVVHNNHSELWAQPSLALPHAICRLGFGCNDQEAAAATTSMASSEVTADERIPVLAGGVAVPAGATETVTLTPHNASNLEVLLLSEVPQVSASLDGAELTPVEVLGAEGLAAAWSSGTATLQITNTSEAAAEMAYVVTASSDTALSISMNQFAPVDSPTAVTVAAPGFADGAEITIEVVAPDGARSSYPATVTGGEAELTITPPALGLYEVTAISTDPWRRDRGFLTATDPVAAIGTLQSAVGADDDGDALFDRIDVSLPITVAAADNVRVVAQLHSQDGSGQVSATSTTVALPGGTTAVTLPFGADRMYALGVAGPLELVEVLVIDDDTEQVLARRATAGSTGTFDPARWQHDPVVIDEVWSDAGVDTDGDGDFDRLEVTGTATVDTTGTYAVNARLIGPTGRELGQFQTWESWTAGTVPITLTFPGRPIGESGIDGPYHVVDLSVYRSDASGGADHDVYPHQTASYAANEFDGGGSSSTVLPDVETPVNGATMGPFLDGQGNLYLFLVDAADQRNIVAMRSGDDGKTWERLSSPWMAGATAIESVDAAQDGSTVHILLQADGGEVRYRQFSLDAATWNGAEEPVPTSASGDVSAVGIAVGNDGQALAVYAGPEVRLYDYGYAELPHFRRRSASGHWSEESIVAGSDVILQDHTVIDVLTDAQGDFHIFHGFAGTSSQPTVHVTKLNGTGSGKAEVATVVEGGSGGGPVLPAGPGSASRVSSDIRWAYGDGSGQGVVGQYDAASLDQVETSVFSSAGLEDGPLGPLAVTVPRGEFGSYVVWQDSSGLYYAGATSELGYGTPVEISPDSHSTLSASVLGGVLHVVAQTVDGVVHYRYPISSPGPAAPGDVAASSAALHPDGIVNDVELQWSAPGPETDIAGYTVYRCDATAAPCVPQDVIAHLSPDSVVYLDENRPGGLWAYSVTTSSHSGDESPPSASTSVSTESDAMAPASPGTLTADVLAESNGWFDDVALNWALSADDAFDVQNYRIYRCTGDCVPGEVVAQTASGTSSWRDGDVPAGTYTYGASAIDPSGNESDLSPTVRVRIREFVRRPDSLQSVDPEVSKTFTGASYVELVDEDPALEQSDGGLYATADSAIWFGLSSPLPGLSELETITVSTFAGLSGFVDDEATVFAQVFAADGETSLTNEVVVGSTDAAGLSRVAFSTVDRNAAAWESATLRLRWSYTKQKKDDAGRLIVHSVEVKGAGS